MLREGSEVVLRVSDGQTSVTQAVNITVTNSREGISVVRVGTGFNQPLYVAPIPGSSNVYVVEKGGNDSVQNGIALSGTVHWMFDRGLLSH